MCDWGDKKKIEDKKRRDAGEYNAEVMLVACFGRGARYVEIGEGGGYTMGVCGGADELD